MVGKNVVDCAHRRERERIRRQVESKELVPASVTLARVSELP